MIIKNLPDKKKLTVSVVPTTLIRTGDAHMRAFSLGGVEYSLEEAPALDGFVGYVHAINGENLLGTCPIRYDKRLRPTQIIALVFTKL